MHLMMLVVTLGLAWYLRCSQFELADNWENRWQQTLRAFLLSPLLLLTTTVSILWMGPRGQMVFHWEGWLSYWLAVAVLVVSAIGWGRLVWQGQMNLQQVRSLPTHSCCGKTVRVLNMTNSYSAQVGFWQPELVISQGLLDTLDNAHLDAVLIHEQAHAHYKDTFCFLWLGWVRQMTVWLPQTELIWEELLALRELRADRWASQQTDSLLVAEALLLVVRNSLFSPESLGTAFCDATPPNRLVQRIEALLIENKTIHPPRIWTGTWTWLWIACLPLLMIPFHA
jgi:Zn-dependent protease with chaperone function